MRKTYSHVGQISNQTKKNKNWFGYFIEPKYNQKKIVVTILKD